MRGALDAMAGGGPKEKGKLTSCRAEQKGPTDVIF